MRLTRIALLVIALIIGAGFLLLLRQQLDAVAPRTFQATEESLVDSARLLAALVEPGLADGSFDPATLRGTFERAGDDRFEARIYEHVKREVGLGCYLTDATGRVLFDSGHPGRVGSDFSGMRDVHRTLRGDYGARSTRVDENDPGSSVLHVAAPVGDPHRPLGVLTVYKAQRDVQPIVNRRRAEITWGTTMIGIGILCFVLAVFLWQYRPIGRLTDYARAIEEGRRPPLPELGAGREVNTLARALESMREALEGRKYAERYVQTLTHEMKSPLAAIRGAAELLDEEMPPADRDRFLANIRAESLRAERLLDRLHQLSALEGRAVLDGGEPVDLGELAARAIDQARPTAELAGVRIAFDRPDAPLRTRGDAFILRAAISNLLENAIDFSPRGKTVNVVLRPGHGEVELRIEDDGPGIPDYARERVFERFFSLRRLRTGRKGTGLGLPLVREAAELHRGSVALGPIEGGGTRATLCLPAA